MYLAWCAQEGPRSRISTWPDKDLVQPVYCQETDLHLGRYCTDISKDSRCFNPAACFAFISRLPPLSTCPGDGIVACHSPRTSFRYISHSLPYTRLHARRRSLLHIYVPHISIDTPHWTFRSALYDAVNPDHVHSHTEVSELAETRWINPGAVTGEEPLAGEYIFPPCPRCSTAFGVQRNEPYTISHKV